MNVVFISSACETLAIEYLSAALKQEGHSCKLCFDPQLFDDTFLKYPILSRLFDHTEIIMDELRSYQPDLVAVSVVSDNFPWASRLSQRIKQELDVPIVFGGVHPTSVPEYTLQYSAADYVVLGEGEGAIVDLADNIKNPAVCRTIPNVWAKDGEQIIKNDVRPLVEDLDSLPFPDKEIFYEKLPYIHDSYISLSSRGCVNKCTFCNNSLYKDKIYRDKGRFFRRRSAQNVLEELIQAKKKYDYKAIHFWDEIFISDRKWLFEFLEVYRKEINVPFTCCIHVNFIDEEVARVLKQSNCWQAIMGVQSLNEDLKRNILNRRESNEKVRNAITCLRRENIQVICENMMGLPTQDESDMVDMLSFYNETRPSRLSVYFLRYYPRTKIINTALEHKMLTPQDVEDINIGMNARSFIQGGTLNAKGFARLQSYLTFLLVLPKGLNRFLIRTKIYKYLPRLGMLAHSFARVLDRDKEFDVDAARFVKRYKMFMLNKIRYALTGHRSEK
jgi:anaerobic magnesium-protoporphyrin IX monomethyl ester cyclase